MKAWPSLSFKQSARTLAVNERHPGKQRRGAALRSVSERQRRQRQRWWLGLSGGVLLLVLGMAIYPQLQQWSDAWKSDAGKSNEIAAVAADPGLRRVIFQGDTRGVDVQGLALRLREQAVAGYLALEPDWIRQQVEAEPWVRAAAVRKDWEGALEIRIARQQPWARWQEGVDGDARKGYVNAAGEVFVPRELEGDDAALPLLQGAAEDAEQMLVLFQRSASALVAANVGAGLVRLHMNPRGAVQLELASGLVIEMGRREFPLRLQRLTHALRQLHREGLEMAAVARVDLRYSHGFALRLHKQAELATTTRISSYEPGKDATQEGWA